MKNYTLPILFLALATVSACVKSEKKTYKVDMPEIKKFESIGKKKGFKCDVVGEADNKELFLQLTEKEGKKSLSLYDFTSASKISIVGAHFAEYNLMSFSVEASPEDEQILVGESILTHVDSSRLSDEGKVLTITGRLTLNKDMSGKLEQKLLLSQDDNSFKTTDLQEIAKIENCEEFEASWM